MATRFCERQNDLTKEHLIFIFQALFPCLEQRDFLYPPENKENNPMHSKFNIKIQIVKL